MPTYEIKSPDGGVFEVTAPEGASEEDIMSYAQANFGQEVGQSTPQNILGAVGEDIMGRATNVARTQEARRQGLISKPEEMLQMAGQGAGLMGDLSGEAMKGFYDLTKGREGYPTLIGGIGAGISGLGSAIGGLPTVGEGTVGELTQQGVQSVGEKYGEFKEEHPRAASNIEAAANIALMSPALGQGENVIKAFSKSQIAKMTSDDVRNTASALFKKADEQGGQLKPEFMDEFANEVRSITPQTEIGAALQGNTEVTNIIDAITSVKNTPMTLRGMQEADEILGNLAFKNTDDFGRLNADGRKVMEIQSILRDKVSNAPQSMFMSGKEGFETVKEARKFWAASLRLRDVERIIQKAEGAAQPSTVIKNGFRSLRDNGKRMKGYSPEEVFAIKKAAKDGAVGGLLKLTGSGLVPIVAGTGGAVASGGSGALLAIPAYGVQQAARAASASLQAGKGRAVEQAIKSRVFQPPTPLPISPLGASLVPVGAASIADETLSQRAQRILDARRARRGTK
jgi:hypothetical protein